MHTIQKKSSGIIILLFLCGCAGSLKDPMQIDIDPRHAAQILYQQDGIQADPDKIKIYKDEQNGRSYLVNESYIPRIEQILGFSAHADKTDLARWLNHFKLPPKCVFLTHGEEKSIMSLSDFIRSKKGWKVSAPKYQEEFQL